MIGKLKFPAGNIYAYDARRELKEKPSCFFIPRWRP